MRKAGRPFAKPETPVFPGVGMKFPAAAYSAEAAASAAKAGSYGVFDEGE
jgi:hypothetical protein